MSAWSTHRVRKAVPEQLLPQLRDVTLDVGRAPTLRLRDGSRHVLDEVPLTDDLYEAVAQLAAAQKVDAKGISSPISELKQVIHRTVGLNGAEQTELPHPRLKQVLDQLFDADNRMGIPGTLHRVSAMRTRSGGVSGITYRVGRHLEGAAQPLCAVLQSLAASAAQGKTGGVLLVGPPGSGKSTLLRDISRMLADEHELSVVVVDSNMELGGDGLIPHPALGSARRMQVGIRTYRALLRLAAIPA